MRLDDEDKKIFEKYAKFEGKNLTSFIRDSVFEKIEDEYDYQVAVEAHEEWKEDNFKTMPFEEVKKEYGVDLIKNIDLNKKYEAIILTVAHDEFQQFDFEKYYKKGTVVYDVKAVLDRKWIDSRL